MPCTVEEAREVLAQADCCFKQEQLDRALDTMAKQITEDFQTKNPLILSVMNGGLIATAQLLLRLDFPLQYDYIHASRYRGEISSGELNWLARPSVSIAQRHVIIVDDIFDEGITLTKLVEFCQEQDVSSVTTAVMVNKIHDRKFGTNPDYIGVEVADRYVFGFGMDYKGYLRNVPGIYAVKES